MSYFLCAGVIYDENIQNLMKGLTSVICYLEHIY